jgi:hypothetical protein
VHMRAHTGESAEGVACVKFGMLSDERDLADLVRLVAQRGHDIEQSSQVRVRPHVY